MYISFYEPRIRGRRKNIYIGYMGTEVGNLTKFGFNDLFEKLIKSPERLLLFKMDNKTF